MTGLTDQDLVDAAKAAELETLSRACRLDPARLDGFLAPDFREFGTSGVELTKDGTAERVAAHAATSSDVLVAHDLRGERVAADVVLVTYVLQAGERRTLRTSLWRRASDGRWQMFHHQGTPAATGSEGRTPRVATPAPGCPTGWTAPGTGAEPPLAEARQPGQEHVCVARPRRP